MTSNPSEIEAVKAANQRFYEAFGALDIQKMDEAWVDSETAMCVHPGWQALVGWDNIRASWVGIFDNTTLMHFNVQYLNVVVHGDAAWVTCIEHISSVLQGRASNFGILATNIFIRAQGPGDTGWRMIAHHAAPNM